jgi:DNA-binding LacI/PurR family transcriptional regulator
MTTASSRTDGDKSRAVVRKPGGGVVGCPSTCYRPNLQARSLRTSRSQTAGLIYSDQESPVHTKLSHAIRILAAESGLSVLTVDHDAAAKGERRGIEQFLDYRVDAVIICYAVDASAYQPLRAAGIPNIQIERVTLPDTHVIAFDPRPGLGQALSALIQSGHHRIGFVGGSDTFSGRRKTTFEIEYERADTFLSEAAARGLDLSDCPVVLGYYFGRDGQGRMSGDLIVSQLLSAPVPVTAIIAGYDVLAAGILQGLYALRLRVPEDISLVGYDDSIADMLSSQLPSIRQPHNEIARAAIDILTQARTQGPLLRRVVSTRLVLRHSIGPARSSLSP